MKLGEAVAAAKQHLHEVFAGQRIAGLAAEAILFDDHLRVWTVTLVFSRPEEGSEREQKVIRISDADARIISVG